MTRNMEATGGNLERDMERQRKGRQGDRKAESSGKRVWKAKKALNNRVDKTNARGPKLRARDRKRESLQEPSTDKKQKDPA